MAEEYTTYPRDRMVNVGQKQLSIVGTFDRSQRVDVVLLVFEGGMHILTEETAPFTIRPPTDYGILPIVLQL